MFVLRENEQQTAIFVLTKTMAMLLLGKIRTISTCHITVRKEKGIDSNLHL